MFVPEKRLSDLRFLEWKYRAKRPDGEEVTKHYGILGEGGGKIIGQISVQPMMAWVGERWEKCQYWGDWYVDPAYRGIGLELLLHVMEQKPLLLATGASRLAYTIYERMKFLLLPIDHRFVFNCRPLTAIIRSALSPRRAARIFLTWLEKPFTRVKRPSLEPGYELSEQKSIDPNLLMAWESEISRGTIFVRREEWLFSWLLDKFPYPEFRLVVLSLKGEQVGYVLLHVRKREGGLVEGKIVDLFARHWNRDHLITLFCEGARRLSESGVHIINYHATHPTFISLAEDSGFTRVRVQSVLAYGPLAAMLSSGDTSLHVTYYDHDEAYY